MDGLATDVLAILAGDVPVRSTVGRVNARDGWNLLMPRVANSFAPFVSRSAGVIFRSCLPLAALVPGVFD
ncbi:MAG: hypothetical protein KGM49_01225 [Sphingomonadales bacterium]|nr:hypothetical protein [Sphingomonadales bacterium]